MSITVSIFGFIFILFSILVAGYLFAKIIMVAIDLSEQKRYRDITIQIENHYRRSVVAGEKIESGQALYINPKDGRAYRGSSNPIGIATRDICTGQEID